MLIQTSILASCQGAIDNIRQHLRATCFDDNETDTTIAVCIVKK